MFAVSLLFCVLFASAKHNASFPCHPGVDLRFLLYVIRNVKHDLCEILYSKNWSNSRTLNFFLIVRNLLKV